jgi:hypothetical protein
MQVRYGSRWFACAGKGVVAEADGEHPTENNQDSSEFQRSKKMNIVESPISKLSP